VPDRAVEAQQMLDAALILGAVAAFLGFYAYAVACEQL
jgi:hypothetical protein